MRRIFSGCTATRLLEKQLHRPRPALYSAASLPSLPYANDVFGSIRHKRTFLMRLNSYAA